MIAPVLNRALVLEDRSRTPDDAGGYRDVWVPLGTLWAELKGGAGRERRAGLTTLSQARYRITVRAAPHGEPSRPKPDQRFRDGVRVFSIEAVSEAGTSGRYLTCHAIEEVVT